MMRGICWFEPSSEDPATPIAWPAAASILASLFLNFTFWITVADRFWPFCPVPAYALLVAGVSLAATTIAVIGPAAAAAAQKRSLPLLLVSSFGELPARALAWICVGFSIFWIAACVSLPVRWWLYVGEPTSWKAFAVAGALPFYLLCTGVQSFRNTAKLAFFTDKLAVALLLAALWRVRDGWPAVGAVRLDASDRVGWEIWRGVTDLVAYMVPFGLLAASLASRLRGRKQVVLSVAFGVAMPLFVSIFVAGIISLATHESFVYQPSLEPNVAMALFGKAASSALTVRWMIAAITTFGVARFCIHSTASLFPLTAPSRRWFALVSSCLAIGWLSLHPFTHAFESGVQFFANCLGAMSAIIMADWILRRGDPTKRIDWPGCGAFLVGISLPWCVPHGPMEQTPNPWWYPWLLPCYGVAFAATILARTVERAMRAVRERGQTRSC